MLVINVRRSFCNFSSNSCLGKGKSCLSGKELFIQFTARAFCKLLSIYVFSYFPFGFEGRIWDLIVSVPDHFLSFYSSDKMQIN